MTCLKSRKALAKTAALLVVGLVLLVQIDLFAAKGEAKNAKKGVVLKFSGFDSKGFNGSSFTLKQGVFYKGSFTNIQKAPGETTIQGIITYQKGNTTFIYPYKHKVMVPKFKAPSPQQ